MKSSGIFYPLSPFPNSQGMARQASSVNSEPGALITPIPPSSSKVSSGLTFTLPVSGCISISATRRSPIPPNFSSLVRHDNLDQEDVKSMECSEFGGKIESSISRDQCFSPREESSIPTAVDENISNSQYNMEISCGRPFCKLKKKEHFHCQICNQAFSEQDRLQHHLMKHMSRIGDRSSSSDIDIEEDGPEVNQDSNLDLSAEKRLLNKEEADDSLKSENVSFSYPNDMLGISSCLSTNHQNQPFPNPLIYSQAGFPGIHNPFGPPFPVPNMFAGSLPRLLPPGPWPGVHPALAAMTHPHLMLPQVRANGELTSSPLNGTSSHVLNMSSLATGRPRMPISDERSSILTNSFNSSPHLALLGKRLGPDDFIPQEPKKIRPSHSLRLLKDEPVPEGYFRFR